ncbi:hypothetical protein CZ787_04020 [Halomonas citrativorans]|uniref:PRC-barrel domain-containing protein n=1 Tax=Halomonas citrativorans TaxID=2742612 RepID=A0A1R4HST0_9GAMM|nr:hypothetical protein CZ787_04020 [Halomonas citrativorans]
MFAEDNQKESGQPEGALEQQEEAVDEQDDAQGEQPAAMKGDNAESSSDADQDESDDPNDLMSRQISDIEGMTVVNMQDEEIGDIDRIVEHKESGDLYAVISIGGVWGIGADEVALPLGEIEMKDDQLVTSTTYGSEEIEATAEQYDEDNFSQIDNSMTLTQAQQHPN